MARQRSCMGKKNHLPNSISEDGVGEGGEGEVIAYVRLGYSSA